MTQTTLNGTQLHQIATATPTAEIINTHLACRERNRTFIDIHRTQMQLLRANEKVVSQDYWDYFKKLEEAGLGVIVYSRKGKDLDSRRGMFKLHYSLKKIAEAGMTGKDLSVERIAPMPQSVKSNPVRSPNVILRKNRNELTVKLKELANNIENADAKRMSLVKPLVQPLAQLKELPKAPDPIAMAVAAEAPKAIQKKRKYQRKQLRAKIEARIISVALRPNYVVEVKLPGTLTKREADLLAESIKSFAS